MKVDIIHSDHNQKSHIRWELDDDDVEDMIKEGLRARYPEYFKGKNQTIDVEVDHDGCAIATRTIRGDMT